MGTQGTLRTCIPPPGCLRWPPRPPFRCSGAPLGVYIHALRLTLGPRRVSGVETLCPPLRLTWGGHPGAPFALLRTHRPHKLGFGE